MQTVTDVLVAGKVMALLRQATGESIKGTGLQLKGGQPAAQKKQGGGTMAAGGHRAQKGSADWNGANGMNKPSHNGKEKP